MRICYVADYAVKVAGSGQSLLNLIEEEKKRGVEPYIVCHRPCELLNIAEKKGITTKVVKAKIYAIVSKKVTLKSKITYNIKRLYNEMHLNQAVNYLKENKIDIVHLNSMLSSDLWAKAARKANIPYIWHIREFMAEDHDTALLNQKQMVQELNEAYAVIAISKAVKGYWEKKLNRTCTLVYNGFPVEDYYENIEKFNQETIRCVIFGRIVEGKGQMDAVKAIERLVKDGHQQFHLTIVGYRGIKPFEIQLAQYVHEHQLDEYITITDYTYDLKEIRRKNDIGLTCSKAEAFGRVTIENMLSGMLVIGTNSAGTPELIKNGSTGFLYPPSDDQKLAELLIHIAEKKQEMKKVALKAQTFAKETFPIQKTAENVFKIYQKAIEDYQKDNTKSSSS